MLILGIESTCDETGAAVVEDGQKVLSNIVASSVDLQKKYGGVVPEVAAREQVRVIVPVIREALEKAAEVGGWKLETGRGNGKLDKESNISLQNPDSHLSRLISNIDAIAVAHGPGLIGSLLIGVETAKALSLACDKPLVPINHLVGHVYANWLAPTANGKSQMANGGSQKTIKNKQYTINFPLIALIVSGGHTDLVLMTKHSKYKLLGSTFDDAAGEAFDKVARVLGLGYPGGPAIEKLASQVRNTKYEIRNTKLPRPMIDSKSFDFSFSGLKTAVVNLVHSTEIIDHRKAEIASEFQRAVVDVLVVKTIEAAIKFNARSIVVGGGVAANEELRKEFRVKSLELRIPVFFPAKELSVDNGAMIAAAAFYKLSSLRERSELNFRKVDPLKLSANPSLHF